MAGKGEKGGAGAEQIGAGANPKQSQGPLNLPYRGGISHNRLSRDAECASRARNS